MSTKDRERERERERERASKKSEIRSDAAARAFEAARASEAKIMARITRRLKRCFGGSRCAVCGVAISVRDCASLWCPGQRVRLEPGDHHLRRLRGSRFLQKTGGVLSASSFERGWDGGASHFEGAGLLPKRRLSLSLSLSLLCLAPSL